MCMCTQSMALGTRKKFQLEILIRSTISAIHKFQENILESSRNVSETPPWLLYLDMTVLLSLCFRYFVSLNFDVIISEVCGLLIFLCYI